MSSSAEQLAADYARGEVDGVPKCGQGKRTKAKQKTTQSLIPMASSNMYQHASVRKSGIKQKPKKKVAKTFQINDAVKALQINSNNSPLPERIYLNITNVRELAACPKVKFNSLYPYKLVGLELEWYLQATKKNGFLGLYLHAKLPDGFQGNYRVEINCDFSISNKFSDKDLIKPMIGVVYDNGHCANGHSACWGFRKVANFEDLLDPEKGFMTPEGCIKVWADFMVVKQ